MLAFSWKLNIKTIKDNTQLESNEEPNRSMVQEKSKWNQNGFMGTLTKQKRAPSLFFMYPYIELFF